MDSTSYCNTMRAASVGPKRCPTLSCQGLRGAVLP